MDEVLVLAALRSPIGRAGGILRHLAVDELAAAVLQAAVAEAGADPGEVDQVILGNAVGPGGNVARVASLRAGLPERVPAVTLDGQCAGGLDAVRLAAALVRSGHGGCFLAGGVESCSHDGRPRARFAPDEVGDPEMGEAAEAVAAACGISRAEQDAWALRSRERALAAWESGVFAPEVVPIRTAPGRAVERDETPRRAIPLERLAQMPPAFRPGGSVTAGNSCRRSDGAAVLLLASGRVAAGLAGHPLARVVAAAVAGVSPRQPGAAATEAIRELARRSGVPPHRVDLFEINEPFAALLLATVRELDLPPERVNPWGGALALGHPYAATGAVLLARLVHGLVRTGGRYGVAAIAAGGGVGGAVLVERV